MQSGPDGKFFQKNFSPHDIRLKLISAMEGRFESYTLGYPGPPVTRGLSVAGEVTRHGSRGDGGGGSGNGFSCHPPSGEQFSCLPVEAMWLDF